MQSKNILERSSLKLALILNAACLNPVSMGKNYAQNQNRMKRFLYQSLDFKIVTSSESDKAHSLLQKEVKVK